LQSEFGLRNGNIRNTEISEGFSVEKIIARKRKSQFVFFDHVSGFQVKKVISVAITRKIAKIIAL
jgi:hypothetical protein